jgi:hypothetical protein
MSKKPQIGLAIKMELERENALAHESVNKEIIKKT